VTIADCRIERGGAVTKILSSSGNIGRSTAIEDMAEAQFSAAKEKAE
jgi:hypothetical protein